MPPLAPVTIVAMMQPGTALRAPDPYLGSTGPLELQVAPVPTGLGTPGAMFPWRSEDVPQGRQPRARSGDPFGFRCWARPSPCLLEAVLLVHLKSCFRL